ncbi:tail protein X [Neisseria meningitidis]|uniref:tail protein X n=1 Tax=Neisseria meningitidis TaxID=487 RepID=UPI000FF091C2|nr:tail protein X [Neisseria meningitidis]RPC12043.1 phage tail protein [Neisseria meningitidis]
MTAYVSKDGDTVSGIAYRHYGASSGNAERLLAANHGLCAHPALLPAGVEIRLPPLPQEETREHQTVNLWD